MKSWSQSELEALAKEVGLNIQHDCGGYRVVTYGTNWSCNYVFPADGVCPTRSRKECGAFLLGYQHGIKQTATAFIHAAEKAVTL